MTYELAKKLKDAGFPQLPWLAGEGEWLDETGLDAHGDFSNTVYIPTLSELIEACGDARTGSGFLFLAYSGYTFPEYRYDAGAQLVSNGRIDEVKAKGSTPEEAVANLWLALQKK